MQEHAAFLASWTTPRALAVGAAVDVKLADGDARLARCHPDRQDRRVLGWVESSPREHRA
jgi:hypothetical protein